VNRIKRPRFDQDSPDPHARLRGEIRACLWSVLCLSDMRQKDVAKKIGCSQGAVSRAMHGSCALKTAALIADACGYRLVVQVERIEEEALA
jgi:hypothetical protein